MVPYSPVSDTVTTAPMCLSRPKVRVGGKSHSPVSRYWRAEINLARSPRKETLPASFLICGIGPNIA